MKLIKATHTNTEKHRLFLTRTNLSDHRETILVDQNLKLINKNALTLNIGRMTTAHSEMALSPWTHSESLQCIVAL